MNRLHRTDSKLFLHMVIIFLITIVLDMKENISITFQQQKIKLQSLSYFIFDHKDKVCNNPKPCFISHHHIIPPRPFSYFIIFSSLLQNPHHHSSHKHIGILMFLICDYLSYIQYCFTLQKLALLFFKLGQVALCFRSHSFLPFHS